LSRESQPHPEIAVVAPSHDRPVRLRWLLNALAEQTLPRERFEVVIGHDSAGPETDELLRTHPLAEAGVLRSVKLPPGTAPPGRNRNAAWRLVRAPIVAFTDDDCRPPPDWVERALAAAHRHPGAIVQGATGPDPEEIEIERHSPWTKTRSISPPRPWAQACNIVYPREVLEAHGGFPEDMYVGEDAALGESARAAGVPYVGAREVVSYHAIEESSALGMVRDAWRWRGMPLLVARHPRLRQEFPLWFFWKREHVWLPLVVAAFFLERRRRAWGALAIPWAVHATQTKYQRSASGRIRALVELPSRLLVDAAEFLSLTWGSIRHRKIFL
jgi:GT2 family glycosyltransferase